MINHMKRLGISCTWTLELILNLPLEARKEVQQLLQKKTTPQPACALQEFVKHIADPLVDKGWNLHLKFGKGGVPKKTVCTRLFSMGAHC